jgi:aspartate racemase
MHKLLPSIRSPVPVLSILDAVVAAAKFAAVQTVTLTGTRFTMTDGFYQAGLEAQGLRVLLPGKSSQEFIHHLIYDDLIYGRVPPDAVARFAACCEQMIQDGSDAILLACTELEMLTRAGFSVPILNSTDIHAEAAWRRAIIDQNSYHSPKLHRPLHSIALQR